MQLVKWLSVVAWVGASIYSAEEMRFTKGAGDLGQYIVQQALKCGAKSVSTTDLPAIKGDWKFSEDQYGVVLKLGRERFDEIQVFLRKAFGPPKHEPTETTDGGKLGWYAASTAGMALQFGYSKEGTQITILRPQKPSVIYGRAAELAPTTAERQVYKDVAAEAKKQERKRDEKK